MYEVTVEPNAVRMIGHPSDARVESRWRLDKAPTDGRVVGDCSRGVGSNGRPEAQEVRLYRA
jgi:hypothetical protein